MLENTFYFHTRGTSIEFHYFCFIALISDKKSFSPIVQLSSDKRSLSPRFCCGLLCYLKLLGQPFRKCYCILTKEVVKKVSVI